MYATDALGSTAVEVIRVPHEANVLATYGAVSINEAADPALATDFLAFLTGPQAQAVLAGHGFLPPP